MGDHRMSVKIETEFHGVKDKCDMWINFSERDVPGVDHRVIEFLRDVHKRGMRTYNDMICESQREQREREEEEREKAELARLKEKYCI